MLAKKIYWTEHAKIKMRQYGLSKTRLMRLLHRPTRKEQGIVPKTLALMQSNASYSKAKNKMPPGEIWIMYKDVKDIRKIISAWRYPGISKPGEQIPLSEQLRQEILESGEL